MTAAPYEVLARKYRSQGFDSLVGQEPIARTLQNAIASNRIGHAYLFCGTRGVGKTSTARIFAKAINVDRKDPEHVLRQPEEIGRAIMRGEDLDVIEIDGASNSGVDQARDLIANAGIRPARCWKKIYIIDEVHMLSTAAFNALLKTMEEPPEHVIFILCTTEAYKVPATIQSRCQRFDFRPIPTQKIAEHLREVLKGEKLEAEPEVVQQIARLGNGSMRDALSVLDRLLAAGESVLTSKLLEEMLGLPDQALVRAIVDAIVASDAAAAIKAGDELLSRGTSAEHAFELLTQYFRDVMVLATCGEESGLVEMSDDAMAKAQEHAQAFDAAGLVHMIAVCDAAARNSKNSAVARAQFDAALARLSMAQHLADIPSLLAGGGSGAAKGAATSAKPTDGPPGPLKKKAVERADERAGVGRAVAAPARAEEVAREDRGATATSLARSDNASRSGDDGESLWRTVLEKAARMTRPLIEHMQVVAFDGQTLRLRMRSEGAAHLKWFRDDPAKLTDIVQKATGRRIAAILAETSVGTVSLPNVNDAGGAELDAVRKSETVRMAMELFNAKVIGVSPVKAASAKNEKEAGASDV